MNSEVLITTSVIALLAAVVAYLFAASQGKKVFAQLSEEFSKTRVEKELLVTRFEEISLIHKAMAEEFRELELDEQKAVSENESLTTRKAELELDLKTALAKVDQSLQAKHNAEKANESAQTELTQAIKQKQELQDRSDIQLAELKAERLEVSKFKAELAEASKHSKAFEVQAQEAQQQLQEAKEKLTEQAESYKQLQERYQSLSNEHTELKTTLEAKEEHFKEQMEQLSETKQSLTKEFENLANKIFEEKGKTFTHTSQTSIDSMLKPFREQIEGFQKRINEVHDVSIQGNTSLNAEIRKVLDIGLQMSKEANNLTSALKGDSQKRGAWGEAQLRRTLEMSGLIEEAHFEVQSAFKDADGKQKQTDYLIKLPDGKHMIIDSKVSLIAYDSAVAAESPEEYKLAMSEHVKAVRKHIDDLSSKDYTNLVGMRSPGFVLMFMPIEPAYIEALKSNKDLFEYGYKKNIVLVSHTTLIPILRTVANLWMMERSNADAREISEKAGDIYNQVCIVAERLSKLGGTLNTASNHYNGAVKALAGQQGLYGKVNRFTELSTKVSKSLPQLEPAHMDFETERLSLIVEPIEEEQTELLTIASDQTQEDVDLDVAPELMIETETEHN